jgi:predicted methyltransferase
MRILFMCIIAGLSLGAFAQEDEVAAKIEAAMAADIRTEADTARDRNRKPVETLGFFQFSDDMRVLELLPGGGWYTKLLAPVLRDKGELYVAIGTNNVQQNLLQQPGFDHVKVLDTGVEFERTGPFNTSFVGPFDFGVSDIDLAVTFRNMHGFTPEGQANINAAVFSALRPGGFYGVIDHSRRHMQQINSENRRRVDVVQVIKDVLDAGFVFVDYSDLHYRPDDELRYEVGRATVTGNTDRFTLLFRKPLRH